MGKYIRNSKSPKWSGRYQKSNDSCKEIKSTMVEQVYGGCGIAPNKHPLYQDLRMEYAICDACESKDVLVTYSKRQIHLNSGDLYYDYEIKCQDCEQYTQLSFSEN